MAVRNFYVDATIDDRQTSLSGGPRSKDGGMTIKVTQRNKGNIEEVCRIECVGVDDYLTTFIYVNGELKHQYNTIR